MTPSLGSLFGRSPRCFLPQVGRKHASFRERNRENRAVAMDDIEPYQQGNAEAGPFHGEALCGVHLLGASEI